MSYGNYDMDCLYGDIVNSELELNNIFEVLAMLYWN